MTVWKQRTLFECFQCPGETLTGKLQVILVDFGLQHGSGYTSHIPKLCARKLWGWQPLFLAWLVGAMVYNKDIVLQISGLDVLNAHSYFDCQVADTEASHHCFTPPGKEANRFKGATSGFFCIFKNSWVYRRT